MTYIRGHRLDFDGWRAGWQHGWGYDDVLPVFKRVEDNSRGASAYRGAGGPLRVVRLHRSACRSRRLSRGRTRARLSARTRRGSSARRSPRTAPATTRRTSRTGGGTARPRRFSCRSSPAPNLQVVTQAQATRLVHRGHAAITGVEYVRDGPTRAGARGARGHPVRRRHRLAQAADAVGHRAGGSLRAHGVPVVADLPGVGVEPAGSLEAVDSLERPDDAAAVDGDGRHVRAIACAGGEARHGAPDLQFYVGRGLDQPDRFVTITVSLVRPRSRGEVRLRSADPAGAAASFAATTCRSRPTSRRLSKASGWRARSAAPRAYEKLRGDEIEPGAAVASADAVARVRAPRRRHDLSPGRHVPHGHRRSAPSSTPRLRVRGVEGLRIADASIMPDVVSATTHAACVMIGRAPRSSSSRS